MTTAILSSVERTWAGTVSAVLNTARQAGAAIGVAAFGAAMVVDGSKAEIISGLHTPQRYRLRCCGGGSAGVSGNQKEIHPLSHVLAHIPMAAIRTATRRLDSPAWRDAQVCSTLSTPPRSATVSLPQSTTDQSSPS